MRGPNCLGVLFPEAVSTVDHNRWKHCMINGDFYRHYLDHEEQTARGVNDEWLFNKQKAISVENDHSSHFEEPFWRRDTLSATEKSIRKGNQDWSCLYRGCKTLTQRDVSISLIVFRISKRIKSFADIKVATSRKREKKDSIFLLCVFITMTPIDVLMSWKYTEWEKIRD